METNECPRCRVVVSQYRLYLEQLEQARAEPAPTVESAPPQPPVRAVSEMNSAGFWIRAAAVLVDFLFFFVVVSVVGLVGERLWAEHGASSRVFQISQRVFQILFGAWYYVLFHCLWGQTFGKMALGIRVMTVEGAPISLWASIGRWLGYGLSALPLLIGYVMAGFRNDKRALHDLIAGTRVVRL
ncbi:MAG: RDD family protein [Candidatus Methylomirabilia bacterium]